MGAGAVQAASGVCTLVNGECTVSTSAIASNSVVVISRQKESYDQWEITTMGHLAAPLDVQAGQSFKIKSDYYDDHSEVFWWIFGT